MTKSSTSATNQTDMFSGAVPAGLNFQLRADRTLGKTWKQRAEDNVTAIRLSQTIEAQARAATPIEQEQLIRFVGFGASDLANGLFPVRGEDFKRGYEDIGEALHAAAGPLLSELARSTQYAHFTPEPIIRAVWRALLRVGFTGGRVLEPGCGSGLFLALMPPAMAKRSQWEAIERDTLTARIARQLYPQAAVRTEDFTRAELGRAV